MTERIMSYINLANVNISVYYDDIALKLTRLLINNNNDRAVSVSFTKSAPPPSKSYSQIFQPHTNVEYSFPNGFGITLAQNEEGAVYPDCIYNFQAILVVSL